MAGVCLLTFRIIALGKIQPDKVCLGGRGLWLCKGHAQPGLEGDSPVHDRVVPPPAVLAQPGVAVSLGSPRGILRAPRLGACRPSPLTAPGAWGTEGGDPLS